MFFKDKLLKALPFISLVFIFVVDFTLIVSTHTSWNSSMNTYLPLQKEIKTLKSDLSIAHLWLEEAIGGDPYIDIEKDIMIPLSHQSFIKYMLAAPTVLKEKPQYLEKLYSLEKALAVFYSIAQQRWKMSGKYGIGSGLDQEFDDKFNAIIVTIDRMTNQIESEIDAEIEEKSKHFSVIISFFIFMNIIAFLILYFAKKREEEAQTLLKNKADYDSLTNLPNRALFSDRLEQGINNAKRHGEKIGLLFIDVDHFKEINDSLGHDIGDIVLQEVGRRLSSSCRVSDTVSRLGGDEFTVIINSVKNSDCIVDVVAKLMETIREPLQVAGHTLHVTLSIGATVFPDDADNVIELLKNADTAMYKAKQNGRNYYSFYTQDMTEKAQERLLLEEQLHNAIEHDEFIVHYQPQIDSHNGKIVGMEGLVRWEHPTKGLLAPFVFLPLAEEIGLIEQIDMLVMERAFKQFKVWQDKFDVSGKLALNISINFLEKTDFVDLLCGIVRGNGMDPKTLSFEVSESKVMQNPSLAAQRLQEIASYDVEIALDDFGTGYSSLSYLKDLPIDRLKIDKSFVDSIAKNCTKEDVILVKTVINLAQGLGLKIIAEGVERAEQVEFLKAYGCSEIQGYFYDKPLSVQDMEERFMQGQK